MTGVITCCKDCQNRTPECHSTCKEYKSQKAEHYLLRDLYAWQNSFRYGFYQERGKKVDKAMRHRRDK